MSTQELIAEAMRRRHDESCPGLIERLVDALEASEASRNFHRDRGITLLDAKWLDPQCHKGCQSLVLKQALEAAQRDSERLNWLERQSCLGFIVGAGHQGYGEFDHYLGGSFSPTVRAGIDVAMQAQQPAKAESKAEGLP